VNGTLSLPQSTTLNYTMMVVKGVLLGAQTLTLANSTVLSFARNASWSNSSSNATPTLLSGSSLILTRNSSVQLLGGSAFVNITVTLVNVTSLEVQAGCSFSATGQGFEGSPSAGALRAGTSRSGNAGMSGVSFGNGGSHAGLGGGDLDQFSSAYGCAFNPLTFGSGGGSNLYTAGGFGGGALHIAVSATAMISGTVTADGVSCPGHSAGGGAGGSIWLQVGSLQGIGMWVDQLEYKRLIFGKRIL
jgi:hypothetical protein